ncbi:hypothetical protein [Morganella morganii]|uniref:hypothetical protein n=1 Tax=Morganella morganii TaxID=582 RepID=UPI001BDB141C|nr:hypothetical protein [Morganella morganii]EKT0590937.1 hypothetical protein [Morganella morganii]EKU0268664.1 hypothetical protein [Morganella morganii]MBT0518101.1 hypothetical protein [Morganella morganii subsp. morganii]QWL90827.1 hypothetical protein IZ187_06520 [Morganella morganii subsp. morganii]HEI8573221.1 hypothetical protein [Morganella morganii]
MKKIIFILYMVSVSFGVNAKVFTDKCNYYIFATAIERANYYRFQLKDINNNLYPGSYIWSFSASKPEIIEILNMAHISRTPVCISYKTYADYWEIFDVAMQEGEAPVSLFRHKKTSPK